MRNFAIRGEELTLEKIDEILATPAEVEELVVWGGPLNNKDLAFIQRLTSLKSVILGEMRIDDGIFDYLRNLQRLEYLVLAYTGISGDFTALGGLPLRDVRLEGCRFVGDACAQTLAAFATLRQLELHMTGVTDAGVQSLGALPLEVLWLGPRITDAGVASLAGMKTLRHLDICAHNVTDEGVAALTNLPLLNKLWLTRCGITDACVEALSGMSALRELNVNSTGITEAGMSRLRRALPACHFPEPD